MPAAVSSTSIGSKYEAPVKTVTGESSAYYIFGLGPIGNDSLNTAIEDAKSQAPSDSIANVFVDRKLICFPICYYPIFLRIDTMVYGTLVKYNREDGSPLEPKRFVFPKSSDNQPALQQSQGAVEPADNSCYTYDCLSSLTEKEFKPAIDRLSQKEKEEIVSTARKIVRACYSDRTTDNIVVPPEIIILFGEKQLLEYMCRTGLLNK